MRRPGYLGDLEDTWFGQSEEYGPWAAKAAKAEDKLAERSMSRLDTAA